MSKHLHSWKTRNGVFDLPRPTALVVRLGALGDVIQAASVCAGLKRQGYSVILNTSYPSSEVLAKDPNIDAMIVQMQDQVPMQWLGYLWKWQESKVDKHINLTEAVETNLLALEGNIRYGWAPAARHAMMNHNYLEFQHTLAGVPYEPEFKFYPTPEETKWAEQEFKRMEKVGIKKVILWALAGSSRAHKIWPYIDEIFPRVLGHYPEWGIVTVGDGSCAELEAGYETKPRIWKTSGEWTIRQVLTFIDQGYADVVVGPETGVMNAAAYYEVPKIIFLSHSTVENLTRDWVNTTSLYAPTTICPGRGKNEVPACHAMIPKFEPMCRRHETMGVAQCVAEIKPEWVWDVLQKCMHEGGAGLWSPPELITPAEQTILSR